MCRTGPISVPARSPLSLAGKEFAHGRHLDPGISQHDIRLARGLHQQAKNQVLWSDVRVREVVGFHLSTLQRDSRTLRESNLVRRWKLRVIGNVRDETRTNRI